MTVGENDSNFALFSIALFLLFLGIVFDETFFILFLAYIFIVGIARLLGAMVGSLGLTGDAFPDDTPPELKTWVTQLAADVAFLKNHVKRMEERLSALEGHGAPEGPAPVPVPSPPFICPICGTDVNIVRDGYIKCPHCETKVCPECVVYIEGRIYCKGCAEKLRKKAPVCGVCWKTIGAREESFECSECGTVLCKAHGAEHDGTVLCPECLEKAATKEVACSQCKKDVSKEYYECELCGKLFCAHHIKHLEGRDFCEQCFTKEKAIASIAARSAALKKEEKEAPTEATGESIESWEMRFGTKWLLKAGVMIILIAFAYLVKFGFEWGGPPVQALFTLLFALGLLVWGYYTDKQGYVYYSRAIFACGLAVLFTDIGAMRLYFEHAPYFPVSDSVYLVLWWGTVAGSVLLAHRYRSFVIASEGLIAAAWIISAFMIPDPQGMVAASIVAILATAYVFSWLSSITNGKYLLGQCMLFLQFAAVCYTTSLARPEISFLLYLALIVLFTRFSDKIKSWFLVYVLMVTSTLAAVSSTDAITGQGTVVLPVVFLVLWNGFFLWWRRGKREPAATSALLVALCSSYLLATYVLNVPEPMYALTGLVVCSLMYTFLVRKDDDVTLHLTTALFVFFGAVSFSWILGGEQFAPLPSLLMGIVTVIALFSHLVGAGVRVPKGYPFSEWRLWETLHLKTAQTLFYVAVIVTYLTVRAVPFYDAYHPALVYLASLLALLYVSLWTVRNIEAPNKYILLYLSGLLSVLAAFLVTAPTTLPGWYFGIYYVLCAVALYIGAGLFGYWQFMASALLTNIGFIFMAGHATEVSAYLPSVAMVLACLVVTAYVGLARKRKWDAIFLTVKGGDAQHMVVGLGYILLFVVFFNPWLMKGRPFFGAELFLLSSLYLAATSYRCCSRAGDPDPFYMTVFGSSLFGLAYLRFAGTELYAYYLVLAALFYIAARRFDDRGQTLIPLPLVSLFLAIVVRSLALPVVDQPMQLLDAQNLYFAVGLATLIAYTDLARRSDDARLPIVLGIISPIFSSIMLSDPQFVHLQYPALLSFAAFLLVAVRRGAQVTDGHDNLLLYGTLSVASFVFLLFMLGSSPHPLAFPVLLAYVAGVLYHGMKGLPDGVRENCVLMLAAVFYLSNAWPSIGHDVNQDYLRLRFVILLLFSVVMAAESLKLKNDTVYYSIYILSLLSIVRFPLGLIGLFLAVNALPFWYAGARKGFEGSVFMSIILTVAGVILFKWVYGLHNPPGTEFFFRMVFCALLFLLAYRNDRAWTGEPITKEFIFPAILCTYGSTVLYTRDMADTFGWAFTLITALQSAIILYLGLRMKKFYVRIVPLAVLSIDVAKIIIADVLLANLETHFKVVIMIPIGVLLIAIAYYYNKIQRYIIGPSTAHEMGETVSDVAEDLSEAVDMIP